MKTVNLGNPSSRAEAGELLLFRETDLNSVEKKSYTEFLKKTIRGVLSRPLIIEGNGRVVVEFKNIYIDYSEKNSEDIAKSQLLSIEAKIKAQAHIQYSNKNSRSRSNPNDVQHYSLLTPITITSFPILSNKGSFTIKGIDRVMVSHLEGSNTVTREMNRKKGAHQVTWRNSTQSRIEFTEEPDVGCIVAARLGMINANTASTNTLRSGEIELINLLKELGIEEESGIFDIIGNNPMLYETRRSSRVHNRITKLNINTLTALEVSSLERDLMNFRLSFEARLANKTLSRDVLYLNKVLYPADHTLSYQDAHHIQHCGIKTVFIDTELGEFPVINNGFVSLNHLINRNIIREEDIPATYIDFNHEEEANLDNPYNHKHIYTHVHQDRLINLINSNEDGSSLKSLLEIKYYYLTGDNITEEDIIAMTNMYSLFSLGIEPEDDRDSLNIKKIVNINEIFEGLLKQKVFGKSALSSNNSGSLYNYYYKLMRDHKMQEATGNNQDTILELLSRDPGEGREDTITNLLTTGGLEKLFQLESNINPFDEVTIKRKINQQNVEGRGGIPQESTDPTPRNVKSSHMGRICCIETPEGSAVGLSLHLATLAKVNNRGGIEAPFFKVNKAKKLIDYSKAYYMEYFEETQFTRCVGQEIATEDRAEAVMTYQGIEVESIELQPVYKIINQQVELTNKLELEAEALRLFKLRQSQSDLPPIDSYKLVIKRKDWFVSELVTAYRGDGEFITCRAEEVDYVACRNDHILSVVAGSIPFNAYNDGTRLLMGCQMQKQSEPVLGSDLPTIKTDSMENIALSTGAVITSPVEGVVAYADSEKVIVEYDTPTGTDQVEVRLDRYEVSSERTLIKYHLAVRTGDYVMPGDVLGDSMSTDHGELKHGVNLIVAYSVQHGYNFEDAIIINERLFTDNVLTSYRTEVYEIEIDSTEVDIETEAGEQILYRKEYDKGRLSQLNNKATAPIGKTVGTGDIIMAKFVPNKKQKDKWVVKEITYDKEQPGQILEVSKRTVGKKHNQKTIYRVSVVSKERINKGDKLAGRHGNKGVISRIVPDHEMPFLEDGTRMDILLTPLGIPSRMNIGQVLETSLGMILKEINARGVYKSGEKINIPKVKKLIQDYYGEGGKLTLYDGVTGKPYDAKVSVGISSISKLKHLSRYKINSRGEGVEYTSNGQPQQGKRNNGGQKYGEMEMDAQQSHNCENVLKEILMKSDDTGNRNILKQARKDGTIQDPDTLWYGNISESTRQMFNQFFAAGFEITLQDDEGNVIDYNQNRSTALGTIKTPEQLKIKPNTQELLKHQLTQEQKLREARRDFDMSYHLDPTAFSLSDDLLFSEDSEMPPSDDINLETAPTTPQLILNNPTDRDIDLMLSYQLQDPTDLQQLQELESSGIEDELATTLGLTLEPDPDQEPDQDQESDPESDPESDTESDPDLINHSTVELDLEQEQEEEDYTLSDYDLDPDADLDDSADNLDD